MTRKLELRFSEGQLKSAEHQSGACIVFIISLACDSVICHNDWVIANSDLHVFDEPTAHLETLWWTHSEIVRNFPETE